MGDPSGFKHHAREPDEARRKALVRLYARIGEAFGVLRSDKRRRVYDAELAAGKTRLEREAEQRSNAQSAAPDPRTPHARKLYEQGLVLIERGDSKAGRAQLGLAAQFEPDSKVIRAALDALDTPAQPTTPATPAVAAASTPTITSAPATSPAQVTAPSPASMPGEHAADAMVQAKVPLVTMRCATWDQVVAIAARIAGGERIFLRTPNPAPKRTPLPVSLRLPDRATLSLESIVDEVVRTGKSGPGMRLSVQADEDTLDALERLIALHKPPNTAAMHAREAFETKRYTDAREAYEKALTAEPEDRALRVGYYVALGYEALVADLRDEARIHFRTAQLLDEASIDAAQGLRAAEAQ